MLCVKLLGLDLQNTGTAHHSNQPMDTLIHTQQQEPQHHATDSSPAAANKVSFCRRLYS